MLPERERHDKANRWPRVGLVLVFLAANWSVGFATEELPPPTALPAAPSLAPAAKETVLTLEDCLRIAWERQPGLAAHRASLAAAEDAKRALDSLHIPTLVARELAVRRKQAALGVMAASSGLAQAERDTAYSIVRNYYTAVFAREQERVARGVVDRLTATSETIQSQLDAGAREVTVADAQRATVYRELAEARRIQASQGVARALAALREAMASDASCRFEILLERLPEPETQPERDLVMSGALNQRGEILQAIAFAQAAELEIEAQGLTHGLKRETFAAVGDIHARVSTNPVRGNEYQPAILVPEMPTLLVGCISQRTARARSLSARAAALCEKTRNLVLLEVEEAWLRWQEANQKIARARSAASHGAKLAAGLSRDFAAGQNVRVDDVLAAQVLAAQARSQLNEYLYQQIIALADLERASGGAFHAGLATGPNPARAATGAAPANAAASIR